MKTKFSLNKMLTLALTVLTALTVTELFAAAPSFSTLEAPVQQGATSIKNIANYGTGAALFIGMVWSVYAMTSNNPSAKNYAIGFVGGFIMWVVVNIAVTI